jgi:DNA-binding response OmpR family regulator
MSSPPLAGLSVLVVEGRNSEFSDLRSSLIKLGANVHVVSNIDRGLMIASRKRLDGAILDCVSHGASLTLCTQLALCGVPFMFYGGHARGASDEAAASLADLISIDDKHHARRRRQFLGSGEDRHLTV